MADSRNMFPAALDLVREVAPSLVLFENVAGLLRASFLPYFEYVEMQLRDPQCAPKKDESWTQHRGRLTRRSPNRSALRYVVTRQLVNAADFGVPQVRKRVFLMAVRSDLTDSPLPPLQGTHSEAALLSEQCVSGLYWERHGLDRPDVFVCDASRTERLSKEAGQSALMPWRTVRDAIAGLPAPIDGVESPGVLNHVAVPGARSYPGHTGSAIDWPSKTIKAGVHGVCGGEAMIRFGDGTLRYMSVREAARVQTFPDDYEFVGARSHAMRLIGNAVPVELAAVVGKHIRAHAGL
jgi:DNA (cytosine-5)-methyltransferase 1